MAVRTMSEKQIRESLARSLRGFGYESVTAETATSVPVYAAFSLSQLREALALCKTQGTGAVDIAALEKLAAECEAAVKKKDLRV